MRIDTVHARRDRARVRHGSWRRRLIAQTRRDAAACAAVTSLQIPGDRRYRLRRPNGSRKSSAPPAGSRRRAVSTLKLPAYSPCRDCACSIDGPALHGKPVRHRGFALALPGDWNGRFLFQGGGGLNGTVAEPIGSHSGRDAAGVGGAASRWPPATPVIRAPAGRSTPASCRISRPCSISSFWQSDGWPWSRSGSWEVHYGQGAGAFVLRGMFHRRPRGDADVPTIPVLFRTVLLPALPRCERAFSNLATRSVAVALNAIAPKDANGPVQGRCGIVG